MKSSLLSLALAAVTFVTPTIAVPNRAPQNGQWGPWNGGNGGHGWQGWNGWNGGQCTPEKMRVRKDFDTMAPAERKAYTDAIRCLRTKPSSLDQTTYSAATDRFMDYAAVHVNRTRVVHLDGFFLTWHRYFLYLFEEDLRTQCGYTGSFPYWNWPATASDLRGSTIFNGDEYSMSGDGYYTNDDPIVLAPGFSLPHGSGGGCVMSGPFVNWTRTMNDIPITVILAGLPLPPTAFVKNESCLTRDLNTFVAETWCNYTDLNVALESPDIATFSVGINGVLGGTSLGLHSGAHFTMGSPASSLFVSPMDPIWYPLHTMLDHVYTSWQLRHPSIADSVYGTETAVNVPPSPNVTLDSVHPDWGYFQEGALTIRDLINTTAGPFCYRYDTAL